MKKSIYLLTIAALLASCGGTPSTSQPTTVTVTDMIGREVEVRPGSYRRVVCIGAGALRMYSYVGDVSLLSGVEDIDNESLSTRPAMFDGSARPYVLAHGERFKTLPSCGVGGPNAKAAEAEKILSCEPDLVISEYEDVDKENALQKELGVPVITLRCGSSGVQNQFVAGSITLLGKVLGKESRAKALNDFIESETQKIVDATKNVKEEDKRTAYVCGLGNWGTTNALMTAQNYAPFNVANINNVVTDLSKDGIQAIDREKFEALAPKMEMMFFDAAAVRNIKGQGFDFSLCAAFKTGEVYLQLPYNAYYINLETALINTWFNAMMAYPSLFTDVSIETKANEITTMFNGKALYNEMKAKPTSYGGYQKIANPKEFFESK